MLKDMKVEGPHPLREIFPYNSTTRYITLPVYQRNFDWVKKHFIDFLEDLEKTTQTWKTDSEEISRIKFHSNFDNKTKERKIKAIERRMEKQEYMAYDGKDTGYYED